MNLNPAITSALLLPTGETASAAPQDVEFVLATDLDGTFLAGDGAERMQLYRMLAHWPRSCLIYVTGRGLESVLPLLSDPTLAHPDYIICDVGCTVVDGRTLQPVQPMQQEIDARWPGQAAVEQVMQQFDGLRRQDVPQERRCSYFCSADAVHEGIREAVEEIGCDLLYSAALYLDVLPKGVCKGSSLKSLIAHLGLSEDSVLVAGDTLNDLSMFDSGFKGVCVGESEHGLLQATLDSDRAFHAEAPGCGGILQAIRHYDFPLAPEVADIERPSGRSELVMVYHRLPYEEYFEGGKLKRRRPRSPNGIIPTLLSFFGDGRPGAWVAWSVRDEEDDGEFEHRTVVDAERYPKLTARRVPLTSNDIDVFYKRFSKEAFWPLLHCFWERARFVEEDWQVFLKVNRAFAEAAAAEAAEGATVWVHDYNLWMVPAFLRAQRPDVKIAFFHHTYFPSADIFNVVPWRREILGSLLQCDYVGFHIPRQVENFVDVARGAMPVKTLSRQSCAPRFLTYGCAVGLDRMTTAIEVGGRAVHMGAHPVGLDVARVERTLAQEGVQKRIEELREEFGHRRVILSLERLDYTKGTLEKLLAFEKLLERRPDLHNQISLMTVCVPAASEMTVYAELQTQIEQAVGRINGRFSQLDWTPVRFFFRALPFEEVVAHYAASQVMWTTPLRDGLNLVAKEFVATHGLGDGRGVLVLSEFAGAAAELKGAILTNPHDIEDMVSGLQQALSMSEGEADGRLRQMFEIVREYDIERWGDEFLQAVAAAADYQNETTSSTVSSTSAAAPQRTSAGIPETEAAGEMR